MELEVNLNSVCRICLEEGKSVSIYQNVENGIKIFQKINNFIGFKILLNSQVPEKICVECIGLLDLAFTFQDKIKKTENLLREATCSFVEIEKEENSEIKEIFKIEITNDSDDEEVEIEGDYLNEINEYANEQESGFKNEAEESEEDRKEDIEIKFEIPECIQSNSPNSNISKEDLMQQFEKKPKIPKNEIKKKQTKIILKGKEYKTVRKGRPPGEPMICDVCGNKYKERKVLESHMRRHRNERPFKCEICGKGFVINVELARHMRVHTGEKPYACKFCGRKFSDYGSKIKHERTHTGERPFKCDIDGCDKAFAYSHALKAHKLVHSGVKAFECDLCQKKFSTARHLKCHMNTLIHKNKY